MVSCTYEGSSLTVGWRKKSTNWEILSVGDPLPGTIGVPGVLFWGEYRKGKSFLC